MRIQARRRNILGMGLLALTATTAMSTPAHAQYGTGMGMGMGMGMGCWGWGWAWGGFSQVPKPESYLYQKSLADSQRAIAARDGYADNPYSYMNRVRDSRVVGSYSAIRREPARKRNGAGPRTTTTALLVSRQTPTWPLASFYGPEGKIGWPANTPTAGDLGERRAAFEPACRAVLDEVKQNSVASIARVADARRKLLDYGRPALEHVRAHESPRVAEAFHQYLLSLYQSLAQAVDPTGSTAAPAQPALATQKGDKSN